MGVGNFLQQGSSTMTTQAVARRRRPWGTYPKRPDNSPRPRKLPECMGPRGRADHQGHRPPQGQAARTMSVYISTKSLGEVCG